MGDDRVASRDESQPFAEPRRLDAAGRAELLERVSALRWDGRFVDAWRLLDAAGPQEWFGAERVAVCISLIDVGAWRQGLRESLLAWREQPDDLRVMRARVADVEEFEGPFAAWRFFSEQRDVPLDKPPPSLDGLPTALQSHAVQPLRWHLRGASILMDLRDYPRASEQIEAVEAVVDSLPNTTDNDRRHRGRIDAELAHLRYRWLVGQDRYDEALELMQAAVERLPRHVTLVHTLAHLLTLQQRDDEAAVLLHKLADETQDSYTYSQLASIAMEQGEYTAAGRYLDQNERRQPRLERHVARSMRLIRAYLALRSDRIDEAIELAKLAGGEVGQKIADRLSDPARRELPYTTLAVPFIRQHDVTCAPTTLTMLANYWGAEYDHQEVAKEICYDGTQPVAEFRWARDHGYDARFFTVTEEVTRQLIEAGVPFALATTDATSGHLQAVMGYDARLGGVVIRDPGRRTRGEMFLDKLLERQAASGPRGMTMLPDGERHRLEGIELPDTAAWAEVQNFDEAIDRHDRVEAAAARERLVAADPANWLGDVLAWRLADYDSNTVAELPPVQRLRERFPDDDRLLLHELALLDPLGQTQRERELLREAADDPERELVFKDRLARELAEEEPNRDEARRLVRPCLRRWYSRPQPYLTMGRLLWLDGDRDAALEAYRFAACLDQRDEFYAERYVSTATAMGRADEAFAWLRERFARFGSLSSQPARTLFKALKAAGRREDAVAVLEDALELRPDDAELALFAAGAFSRISVDYHERSEKLLAASEGKTSADFWTRVSAHVLSGQGKYEEAATLLREQLDRTPLHMAVHGQLETLLEQTEGDEAVITHYEEYLKRFPKFSPFRVNHIVALRTRGFEATMPVLRAWLEETPHDPWLLREAAGTAIDAGQDDEGRELLERAAAIDSRHTYVKLLQARLHQRAGEAEDARERLREVLRDDIDEAGAITALLEFCETHEQRRAEFAFLIEQLKSQPVSGPGLERFHSEAVRLLPPEELDAVLGEAIDSRPDLVSAWLVRMRQLRHHDRLDEAAEVAAEACSRFPLEAELWGDRSQIAAVAGHYEERREYLERAQQLAPSSTYVLRELSEACESLGDFETSRELLEQAVALGPMQANNRGFLADLLIKLQDREGGQEQLEQALRLSPDYGWAWSRLSDLVDDEGCAALARRITEESPHHTEAFLRLAHYTRDADEAAAALDVVERRDPFNTSIYSIRSRWLADAGRIEEAIAALEPEVFPTPPPHLRSRRASLHWRLGNPTAAIDELRQVLQDTPDNGGDWERLIDWCLQVGDRDGAVEAARTVVALAPHDAPLLKDVGDALERCEDIEGATAAYETALRVDPSSVGVRFRLIDRYMESDRWDEVVATMAPLEDDERTRDRPPVLYRQLEVAVHNKQIDTSLELYNRLIRDPETWGAGIFGARRLLAKLDLDDEGRRDLVAAVRSGEARGSAGALWMDDLLDTLSPIEAGERLPAAFKVERRVRPDDEPELSRMAFSRLNQELSEDADAALQFLTANGDWLKTDTHLWASGSYLYCHHDLLKPGLRWVADWPQRDDVTGWMLTNVHELFRSAGDLEQGRACTRHALTLPEDHCIVQHRMWAAFDALQEGDEMEALSQYVQLDVHGRFEDDEFILMKLVGGLVRVLLADDDEAAVAALKQDFADVQGDRNFRKEMKHRRVLRQLHAGCARLAGQLAPSLAMRLWVAKTLAWNVLAARVLKVPSEEGNGQEAAAK